MTSHINIVYTISDAYFDLTYVSIHSLFENNKNNFINLFVLYDESFDKNYLKLLDIFNKYENCLELTLLKINKNKYSKLKNYYKSLYCLEFPFLVDIDKFIYINSASLILKDLRDFYNIDISSNSCAATEFLHNFKDSIPQKRKFIFTNYMVLINAQKVKKRKLFKHFIISKVFN